MTTSPSDPDEPGDAQHATRDIVEGEVHEFQQAQQRRNRQFPFALLVGLLAGLVALAFRVGLSYAEQLRNALLRFAHAHAPWAVILPVAFGAAFAGLSVLLVRKVAPEAVGSGVPHLKAVLHHHRPLVWQRVLPVKFVGGVLAIGSGLALGREGPTIQMGASVAAMVARWLRTTPQERRTLIAAGAGAGLAAAFNAPLSGLIFVLEEVQHDFTPSIFTATFIASVTADVVTRWFDGQSPVFHVAVGETPPIASLPAFLVLGLAAGVLGVAFNRGLLAGLDLFQRARGWPAGLTGAVVGAGVGLLAWFAPTVVGTGHDMLEGMFAGRTTIGMLVAIFALRFVLTSFSYGSGAPGGIFAPLLLLGAALGLMVGDLARRVSPSVDVAPAAFAVVGMAAYFAAIVRAPLTGIILIIEMTGRYDLMLPLLVACLAAYATADLLGDLPIYERLLQRELARGPATPEGPVLVQLTVDHGAPFHGKEVRELDLPAGCVLITVSSDGEEHVPTPNMPIHAGDHLALLVAPEAMIPIASIRKGTTRVRAP